MALVNFIILFGLAAAWEESQIRSAGRTCSDFDVVKLQTLYGITFEGCMGAPEMVAVANAAKGTPEQIEMEVITQCILVGSSGFPNDFLEAEYVKQKLANFAKGSPVEKAVYEALDSCDSTLLESYQAYQFMQCIRNYCEGR